ncbi:MAG TPA: HAD-IIIA family hydrolase [Gemmatimonadales bacterium]|nr:HAD-IIIA family hydrolase [Gemmatimonadales bacterium]
MNLRPAAFLDRDGTIIEDTGFVRDRDGVRLIKGSAEAIRRLNEAGWVVVVVTNQSGIARGLFTTGEYDAVASKLDALLAEHGARIDASYMCPHHPDVTGPCDCRKPGLKHYLSAAERFGIDFTGSIYVGDRMTDLEAARSLGGTAILVQTGDGRLSRGDAEQQGFAVVRDLNEAVDRQLARLPDR